MTMYTWRILLPICYHCIVNKILPLGFIEPCTCKTYLYLHTLPVGCQEMAKDTSLFCGAVRCKCFRVAARILTTQPGSSVTASKRAERLNAHGRLSGKCCELFTLNMAGNMFAFPLPSPVQSLL